MSSHKQQRTFLFRIICMVMLVLIQFDAYGYEMVGHFRENVQPMYSLSAPESLAEGNQENTSWCVTLFIGLLLPHSVCL